MQDFKMSGSNMNELLTNMKAIKERIDDSYDELTRLMSRIESVLNCGMEKRKLLLWHIWG